jgi:hypothetical protein
MNRLDEACFPRRGPVLVHMLQLGRPYAGSLHEREPPGLLPAPQLVPDTEVRGTGEQ